MSPEITHQKLTLFIFGQLLAGELSPAQTSALAAWAHVVGGDEDGARVEDVALSSSVGRRQMWAHTRTLVRDGWLELASPGRYRLAERMRALVA